MRRTLVPAALLLLLTAVPAHAATYRVGSSRPYTTLGAVAPLVNAGDIVEVDGNATYASVRFARAGAPGNPVIVRGIRVNGKRPVISGGTNSIEIAGDHYVVEAFEITGGASRCVYHHAHDVIMRDLLVHDCPKQGILGADQDSGSLTLEYSEVHHCGGGTQDHQIYMATDEVANPGAVFRMQHCYIHDANGGNSVKSRAQRNEIYYNWIEGALYHELELIGPDPNGAPSGWSEGLAREDSDVVGNVLRKTGTFSVVRFGGDGTGQSNGRYRFVANTVVTQPGGSAVFRLFTGLESVEMHGNVFALSAAGSSNLLREVEAAWTGGRVVSGSKNWVTMGATNVPPEWTGTLNGAAPGFVSLAGYDLHPAIGSALKDAGPSSTASPNGHSFPSPLAVPAFQPPMRTVALPGTATARAIAGAIDIGAYESHTAGSGGAGGATGSGGTPGSGGALNAGGAGGATPSGGATSTGGMPNGGAPNSGGVVGSGGLSGVGGTLSDGGAAADDGGCTCRVGHRERSNAGILPLVLAVAVVRIRRRSMSTHGLCGGPSVVTRSP